MPSTPFTTSPVLLVGVGQFVRLGVATFNPPRRPCRRRGLPCPSEDRRCPSLRIRRSPDGTPDCRWRHAVSPMAFPSGSRMRTRRYPSSEPSSASTSTPRSRRRATVASKSSTEVGGPAHAGPLADPLGVIRRQREDRPTVSHRKRAELVGLEPFDPHRPEARRESAGRPHHVVQGRSVDAPAGWVIALTGPRDRDRYAPLIDFAGQGHRTRCLQGLPIQPTIDHPGQYLHAVRRGPPDEPPRRPGHQA